MATIVQQQLLKDLPGTTSPEPTVTGSPVSIFSRADIESLLGISPLPEGIRFHFEKSSDNRTIGLIGVGLGKIIDISETLGTRLLNIETPLRLANEKYLLRGSRQADLSLSEYTTQFPQLQNKGTSRNGITNACVFFSRLDMRTILDQTAITHIGFYLSTITRTFPAQPNATETPETFDTLIAVGHNSAGAKQGIQIKSEFPCPPHCGEDYPPPA